MKDVATIDSHTPQASERMKAEPQNLQVIFVSDITTRSSTEWKNRNPLNCIAGEEGSLIHYWGRRNFLKQKGITGRISLSS